MEKKTKKSTKKLFVSIVAMLLAIVGAATSTYAWFTMNASPQVGQFQVKVTTISGLEIALDTRTRNAGAVVGDYAGLDYKTYISGTEVENYLQSISRPTATGGLSPNSVAQELLLAPAKTSDGKTFSDIDGVAVNPYTHATDPGKFLNSEDKNDVGYLEFSLYFRMSATDYADMGGTVLFDMYDYTGQSKDNRDTGIGGDVRTYVKHSDDTATATTFTLPTTWNVGAITQLTAIDVSGVVVADTIADASDIVYWVLGDVSTQDYYVIVDADGETVLGINMNKYFGETSTTFVNPLTKETRIWNSATHVLGADTGTIYTHDNIANGNEVIGYGANALRLSFSEVNNGTLQSKTTEDSTVIWDPRNDLGIFDNNDTDNNFALHMLWAITGRGDITVPGITTADDYFDDHITDRSAAAVYQDENLASQIVCTLGNSVNGYHYGATTIRIWIDGFDGECFNGIMANIVDIGFQFKLASKDYTTP